MWANYSGSSTARNQVGWQAANKIYIQQGDTTVRISTQTFTSTTDWVHIVVAWDSSQGTAADRLKVYIDGSEITAWDTNAAVGQNSDIRANNGKIYLGRRETSSLYFDGYLADFRSVDGQQLTPSTFGQTVSGVWKPKTVTGLTYGTNGFYLDFADSSALGNDVSGNNIDFTVANLTSGDRSTDTPQPSAVPAAVNTGSSTSAELQGSAGAKYYEGQVTAVAAVAAMTDASSSAHTVTATNAVISTASKKIGTHSIAFDGDGDRVEITSHSDFSFGTNPFTIEFWYNVTVLNGNTGSSAQNLLIGDNGYNSVWAIGLMNDFYPAVYLANTRTLYSATVPTLNTWYHLAWVREGSGSNQSKLYINGTLASNGTGTVGTNFSNSNNLFLGQQGNTSWRGTTRDLEGYLEEIRISNVARYTSNFTAFGQGGGTIASPTQFTSDANTKLLVHGGAVAAVAASDSMSLISTTTTAQTAPTKADIMIQTEDEVGTATINTDVKVGVSRDALNYVDTTLVNKGTWGTNQNVWAANDVTIPGTITKAITARSSKFHIDEVETPASWSTSTTPSAASEFTGSPSSFSYGSGTVTATTNNKAMYSTATLSGDFEVEAKITAGESAAGWFGVFDSAEVGSFNSSQENGNMVSFTDTWFIATQARDTKTEGLCGGSNSSLAAYTCSNNDVHKFKRVGSTLTVYQNGTLKHTATNIITGTMHIFFGAGGGGSSPYASYADISWKSGWTALSYSNQQPTLELTEGYTYKFDTSHATLSGHTFKFATAADAAGSTQYTTGVTESGTPGSANAYTQIAVAGSAPTLYYYCSNHASMGGTANTPAEATTTSMRYKIETKNQSYTAAVGTAYTVSAVSNATTSTTQKKFGTHSLSFPANGDYFSIEDNATWDYGTGDFTWEMWIYLAAISSQKKLFGSNQWGTQTYDWIFDVNPNRTLRLQLHGPPSPELSTSSTVPVSTWCHVACSRSSGTVKIFIDGTQGASTTMAQNLANVGTPFLGWKPANSGDGFIGYMDEVRLSNTARYTSNFTPATSAFTTDANTQLLLHGDGNLTDSSYTAESGKITRIHGTSLAWS